jgi:hypothetical protein
MLTIERNDNKIIAHLRKVGLYHHFENQVIPPDVQCPTLIYKSGEDVFIEWRGHPAPKDNGFMWLHLEHASKQERKRRDKIVLSIVASSQDVGAIALYARNHHSGYANDFRP